MTNSVALKLDRAEEHLEAFKIESNVWIESKPYRIVDEPNLNPPLNQGINRAVHHRRFRIVSVDHVPDRLSVLIGDCVFNMRSALDHLALSLAQSFVPSMTDRQIATSEFPVFHAAPMNARTETSKIGCIDPIARNIIKALQPHYRGDQYKTHPLWQLHELNRIDKHRTLTICTASPIARGEDGVGTRAVGIIKHEEWNIGKILYCQAAVGELIADAVLMQYGVLAADPKKDVYMQPVLSIEVAFGETKLAALESVIPSLEAILDFVRNSVVAPLSNFL